MKFINWIKYVAAKMLRAQMMPIDHKNITEEIKGKFNHLQFLIITYGKVKWNWKKILMVKVHSHITDSKNKGAD